MPRGHRCEEPDLCGVCSAVMDDERIPTDAEMDWAADEYFDRKARLAHEAGY